MLKHGMVMYDALYAWCRSCQDEALLATGEGGLTAFAATSA